jgi:peptide/nickel transport system permease protein
MLFVLRKIGVALITMWIAVTVAFILSQGIGDPALQVAGDLASPEQVELVRAQLGLDVPLWQQYLNFIGSIITGDFGQSIRYNTDNVALVMSRLPNTAELAITAIVIAAIFGVLLGVIAAVREGSAIDRIVSAVSLVGQSVPLFWLGLMLTAVFAVNLGWLPAGRNSTPAAIILPAVTLATLPMAMIARLTRASLTGALRSDYVMAARARGLPMWSIVFRHALKNAALPVITVVGLQLGLLLSGAVTVEVVFSWPGIGTLMTQAVGGADFTLIRTLVIFAALIFVVVNLLVELLYVVADPRLRREQS